MTPAVKYLAGAVIILSAIIGAYFYGVHASDNAWRAKMAASAVMAQAAVDRVTAENQAIAKDKAASDAKVIELATRIANQKPQEKIVYVKIKADQPAQAVTGPVYITWGAVSLFDAAFGVSGVSAASGLDHDASDTVSGVTVSQYIDATERNGAACYANQQQVTYLQRYILSLGLKPAA